MPKIMIQETIRREVDLTFDQLVSLVKSLSPDDRRRLQQVLDAAENGENWLLPFAGAWQMDDAEYEQFQRELHDQRRLTGHRVAVPTDEE